MTRGDRRARGASASRSAALAALSWVALSCAHHEHAGGAEAREPALDLPAQSGSLDVELMRLNFAVRSFAGIRWDEGGVLRVSLGDPSQAEAARPKVLELLARIQTPGFSRERPPQIVFEPAKTPFTWFDLTAFKEQLRDVITLQGVTFLDADEVRGVVTIGIAAESARDAVEDFVKRAGVPAGAVQIVPFPAFVPLASLTDQFRPMPGGIQVKNDAGFFHFIGISEVCTLTAVGDRLGAAGFVTCSHCTRVQGGVEGTNYYQNGSVPLGIFGLDYVGHESADPPWTAGPGCATGKLCRASDSAFAVIDIGNQNGAAGVAARPTTLCTGTTPCTLAMPSASSALTFTGLAGPLLTGAFATKIGRTTGWTGGPVIATCATVPQAGTSFVTLCQTIVTGVVAAGDSGSPIIAVPAGATAPTTGTLAGILWGGSQATATAPASFVFSPIAAVASELSPLQLLPGAPAATTPSKPPSQCVQDCRTDRDGCMKSVGEQGGPRPSQCVAMYRSCLDRC